MGWRTVLQGGVSHVLGRHKRRLIQLFLGVFCSSLVRRPDAVGNRWEAVGCRAAAQFKPKFYWSEGSSGGVRSPGPQLSFHGLLDLMQFACPHWIFWWAHTHLKCAVVCSSISTSPEIFSLSFPAHFELRCRYQAWAYSTLRVGYSQMGSKNINFLHIRVQLFLLYFGNYNGLWPAFLEVPQLIWWVWWVPETGLEGTRSIFGGYPQCVWGGLCSLF